jgi:hypothetical protein
VLVGFLLVTVGLLVPLFGKLQIQRYHGKNILVRRFAWLAYAWWPPKHDGVAIWLTTLTCIAIGVLMIALSPFGGLAA